MKKLLSLVLCLTLITALFVPSQATAQENVVYSQETVLEDGTVMLDELIVSSHARLSEKTAERRKTFSTSSGDTIAVIAFQATYIYNGSLVRVSSKSVTQTDTYNNWKYTQESFTSSIGTVSLSGKITKLLHTTQSFTMTMTCDENGNISAS